jgi:hypothetical protein
MNLRSAALATALLATTFACSKKDDAAAADAAPAPAASAAPAAEASSAPAAPAAEPAGPISFKFTESPKASDVPAEEITGDATGKRIDIKTVVIEPGFKEWKLVLSEKTLDKPTAFVSGGQSVNVNLPEEPAAGKKWTKAMKYGDGYFQIEKADTPGKFTSWNASNAYYIEITSWDVKPYDAKGSVFQEAGKASGKVYVAYKGSGSFKDSGVAGTFKDAVVRYMGKPYWLKDKDKKK